MNVRVEVEVSSLYVIEEEIPDHWTSSKVYEWARELGLPDSPVSVEDLDTIVFEERYENGEVVYEEVVK